MRLIAGKYGSTTNRGFFVQYACGLSTTPTLQACADAIVHARAQCRKGSSSHNHSSAVEFCNTLHNSGYRVHMVYML